MAVDRRFVYWGVFLFALGGVTLAAQGGIFGSDAAAQALRLWPVAIIALGAGLLLHRTRFGLAGGLVAAAMPGLLLGGALVAAPRLVPECGGVSQPGSVVSRQGTFDGPATVDLTFACGDLSVITAPGDGWLIQTGDTAGSTAKVDLCPRPAVGRLVGRMARLRARARRRHLAAVSPHRDEPGPGRRDQCGAGQARPRRRPAAERQRHRERGRRAGRPVRGHGRTPVHARQRGSGFRPAADDPGSRRRTYLSARAHSRSARRAGWACESTPARCSRRRTTGSLSGRVTPGKAPAMQWQTTTRT